MTGHAIFAIELTTHSASCPKVEYVLHEAAGKFTDQVKPGDGSTTLTYVVDLGPAGTAPTTICVFFTSEIGSHVADRSPDASIKNCVEYELDPDGSPGGEGFDQ